MSALSDALLGALLAVAPVCNLDIGDEGDRSTWRVGFTSAVTDEQKAAAANVVATFVMPVVPVPLAAYAAAARYTKETAGITVGGAAIATDRDSQNLIAGAYSYVLAKPDATIRFKGTSGWVTLTADQVQGIALAVGAYVQACFAAESQADDGIQAGTITTTAQIDAAFATIGA